MLYPEHAKFNQENRASLEDSLKIYFFKLSQLISILLPLSANLKYRNTKAQFKQILIDEFISSYNSNSGLLSKTLIGKRYSLETYIVKKVNEYSINNSGSCRYCSSLDIDLNMINIENKTIDSHIEEILSNNNEYNHNISRIRVYQNMKQNEEQSNDTSKSLSLNENLFSKLPNLANLFIEGLKLKTVDKSIKKCIYLKNIELTNNSLITFPESLLLDSLQQFVIENNPIQTIPKELFKIKNLKSIVLSMLNLTSLPDNWSIEEIEQKSSLKSLIISQTKLNTLPNDLLRKNLNIGKIIFDGVHLILPETQQNWSTFLINMETLTSLYCPVLLSYNEATELFKKYDYDRNLVLNYTEIQHLNAELFEKYPRLGDKLSSVDDDVYGGLPIGIFHLKSLSYLDLSFQAIRKIPDAIEGLKGLKTLKLKYCIYLETLSSLLSTLPLLKELDLIGCLSLKTPPAEIQRKGFASIIAYLRRLRTGSVSCQRTKLMLVGHGASGKTSLANCLLDSMYGNKRKTAPDLTDGISIRNWVVPINNEESSLTFSVYITFCYFI
jgi:Leucine-rich repeat (LRR) protein